MPRQPRKSAFGAFKPSGDDPPAQELISAPQLTPTEEQVQAATVLKTWEEMAQGAYPPNTVRAWRADWKAFTQFCFTSGESPLPAAPYTVRTHVQHCMNEAKKPAGIRRYLATISRAHRAAELLSPCASEPVRLALKELSRTRAARQRQARPLCWAEIKQFLETAGKGIRADRERALLCVAYDTMARRSELVSLDVEDLTLSPIGAGTALIRRSKTDQAGEGARAYLSKETVRHLLRWLQAGNITEGAVFRRLVGRERVGPRLHADMADIFKRVGRWIKLPPEEVAEISGHSIRVGGYSGSLGVEHRSGVGYASWPMEINAHADEIRRECSGNSGRNGSGGQ